MHFGVEQLAKWLIINTFPVGRQKEIRKDNKLIYILFMFCIDICGAPLTKLLRRLLKLLLEHAAKAGAIGITNHKGNFTYRMLAFQQQLGGFVEANGGHKFMYRLIGERFYFPVKLGTAQQ